MQTFIWHSVRRIAPGVLFALIGLMFMLPQKASAVLLPCATTTCATITIYNCTSPAPTYQVEFQMCCNGMLVSSGLVTVPPLSPPFPCRPSRVYTPAPGCVIVGVLGIIPAPIGGYFFDPANCRLDIF